VNSLAGRTAQAVTSIRVRLAIALCVALLPVLILGGMQSVFAFRAEADSRRQSLELAAGRSAAIARARIEAAGVLLQTLGPRSVGLECAQRLADVRARLPGYANLVRFDARGRVACAAATTPYDPQRSARSWFQSLRGAQLWLWRPILERSTQTSLRSWRPFGQGLQSSSRAPWRRS